MRFALISRFWDKPKKSNVPGAKGPVPEWPLDGWHGIASASDQQVDNVDGQHGVFIKIRGRQG
jgi:hypothetical protein